MQLRYFAWVRERIGQDAETVDLPGSITTVADLLDWLASRDEGYASAFADREIIRVALDQEHAEHDAPLAGVREAAFFPPMTGG
ncbi:molybdopterin converting factor subunit 1 [Stappia indica]|uniref:Molybdopterin converting factor subunit 1 n=1 Tax=Stappia indica TaxID=538381 RepID=A0A857C5Q5_9HYPH|nr:molybdopterin converting factor subunit 1 [Stappia indica]QGZ34356.1 molybdopterin converting factor subunit 1 [Stappia indica]